jgi:hypothetical protein
MGYTWNYQGDNDDGKLSYGTVAENVYAFQNSGGWVLISGHRQTGTLYLTVTHNGQTIFSTSWEVDIEWH